MAADNASTADSGATRRIGQTVGGKYELRDVLGIGGMATVYAGFHRNGLAVAIKVLHDELASDESVRRWFLREAYLANRVNHRGAVRVLDDDVTEDGAAYLVIERLYGDTLRAIWERAGRKMPPKEVALFAYDVLDVLSAAHARGIIHRDIKPENLFVTDEGEVKVLDFGIAHPLPIMGEAAAMTTMRLVGTPAYMAPEQARGSEVRAETDVWGVGATMFSLITGEYVHAGAPPPDLLTWAATRPARGVRELARDLPSGLAAVMDRALAFEPEERFATAHAMREALGEAFASAFGGTIGDARGAVIGEMRGRESVGGRTARRGDVHSVATRAPGRGGTEAAVVATRTAAHSEPAAVFPAPLKEWVVVRRFRDGVRRRRATVAVAICAALSAIVGAYLIRTRFASVKSDVTSPNSAVTAYRSGMEAWHDGRQAELDFERALTLDPTFTPAHLALALIKTWPDASTYVHFAQVLHARDSLNEADRALLDASEPGMRVPPDVQEVRRRLEPLIDRYPTDFRFSLVLGAIFTRLGDGNGMLRLATSLLAADPTSGALWNMRAVGYDLLGDVPNSRASFNECIARSRMPTRCMNLLAQLESNEGSCDRVESIAQTMLAAGDKSPQTFELLSEGVFGRSKSAEMLSSVLERAARAAEPPSAASAVERSKLFAELLSGDFEAARQTSQRFETLVAGESAESVRMQAAEYSIDIAKELGQRNEALARAKRFANERPSLDAHPEIDVGVDMDRSIYEAGEIDASEFYHRRDDWVLRQSARFKNRSGAFAFIWIPAYAEAAQTKAEALDAIDRMSDYLPVTDPINRSANRDEAVGRVYLLAERYHDAIPYLDRAARSCKAPVAPLSVRWAQYELGVALAAVGRKIEACGSLHNVINTWGNDPRSVTGKKARLLSANTHCEGL